MGSESLVFVVDPDVQAREAAAALAARHGLRAEQFASVDEFLARYGGAPGVVVIDLNQRPASGTLLLEELRSRGRHLSIVGSIAQPDTATIVRALQGGALTVLDKPWRGNELSEALEAALEADAARGQRQEELAMLSARFASLSDKERDVLRMIVAGRPNKAMANALGASLRTIENRRREVFSKLGVRSVAELVTLTHKVERADEL